MKTFGMPPGILSICSFRGNNMVPGPHYTILTDESRIQDTTYRIQDIGSYVGRSMQEEKETGCRTKTLSSQPGGPFLKGPADNPWNILCIGSGDRFQGFGFGHRFQGFGFDERFQGFGFGDRLQGLGFRVRFWGLGLGFRFQVVGLGFRVQGLGFRVQVVGLCKSSRNDVSGCIC